MTHTAMPSLLRFWNSVIDPFKYIGHYKLLVKVVERIMKRTFIQFQRLVPGTRCFKKMVAAAWFRRFVFGTMKYQHGQRYLGKFLI